MKVADEDAGDAGRCDVGKDELPLRAFSGIKKQPFPVPPEQIRAVITETGRFHFLDEFDFQGSGIVSVSVANEIDTSFRFVPPVGSAFADGSVFADCSASGFAKSDTIMFTRWKRQRFWQRFCVVAAECL